MGPGRAGRIKRVTSLPSRRKISVGHSLTPNERPSRRPLASAIFEVAHTRVIGQSERDVGLGCTAMTAPGCAELDDHGPFEPV